LRTSDELTGTTYLTEDFGLCSNLPVVFPTHNGETRRKRNIEKRFDLLKNIGMSARLHRPVTRKVW
jgi:hypothetical protein